MNNVRTGVLQFPPNHYHLHVDYSQVEVFRVRLNYSLLEGHCERGARIITRPSTELGYAKYRCSAPHQLALLKKLNTCKPIDCVSFTRIKKPLPSILNINLQNNIVKHNTTLPQQVFLPGTQPSLPLPSFTPPPNLADTSMPQSTP